MESLEILQDVFYIVFYGGVIMLDILVALYLLLRSGNAYAREVESPVRLRRWAAVFLFSIAISHVYWLVYTYWFYSSMTHYLVVCGLDLLLLFPSIVGILMSMLQDRRRPVWPFMLMMVPTAVLLIVSIVQGGTALFVPLRISVVLLYALLIVFIFIAVRHYGYWLRDNYADLERKEVWQSTLILALFLLFFVIYCITTGKSRALAYFFQIYTVILVLLLVWRVETLQSLSEPTSPERAAPTPQTIPANIGPLLKMHCEEGQLYLQHDLTLAQLAQVIGTNRYYLSQYFAQQGLTYNTYINNLRIRHFANLYHNAVEQGCSYTAQQLAFESGYHSYSTFSAVFKQHTGKTVTAWMRSVTAE